MGVEYAIFYGARGGSIVWVLQAGLGWGSFGGLEVDVYVVMDWGARG